MGKRDKDVTRLKASIEETQDEVVWGDGITAILVKENLCELARFAKVEQMRAEYVKLSEGVQFWGRYETAAINSFAADVVEESMQRVASTFGRAQRGAASAPEPPVSSFFKMCSVMEAIQNIPNLLESKASEDAGTLHKAFRIFHDNAAPEDVANTVVALATLDTLKTSDSYIGMIKTFLISRQWSIARSAIQSKIDTYMEKEKKVAPYQTLWKAFDDAIRDPVCEAKFSALKEGIES
eukprot:7033267-Pyramimonas_sp.AAC.1